ncbi:hypothetical protein COCCADRAFT_26522 [Bipolaris zeicola 26-R-13]|uniref:Uncharacterized protein n=1 Tax=Cochliobolus carbonum (strain 26-R-13) TaxID=930089 RepID=W6YC43_COCC2|nr:uncharacterized protein COCCADRAFT_26522 [Bipolaris zeicola 26-R-13]EUC33114.1 hypothetical protein COCCADRAFT_26522 [Bipolaris zeicola 26-R-13]
MRLAMTSLDEEARAARGAGGVVGGGWGFLQQAIRQTRAGAPGSLKTQWDDVRRRTGNCSSGCREGIGRGGERWVEKEELCVCARGQGSGQRQGSGPARRRPGTDKPQTEFFSANFANDTPMPQTACLDLDSVPPCRSGPSPRQDMAPLSNGVDNDAAQGCPIHHPPFAAPPAAPLPITPACMPVCSQVSQGRERERCRHVHQGGPWRPPAPTLPLPADRRPARPRASCIQLLRISMHVEVRTATVALPLHPAKEGDPMPETEASRGEGSIGKAGSVLACIVITHHHQHHHCRITMTPPSRVVGEEDECHGSRLLAGLGRPMCGCGRASIGSHVARGQGETKCEAGTTVRSPTTAQPEARDPPSSWPKFASSHQFPARPAASRLPCAIPR